MGLGEGGVKEGGCLAGCHYAFRPICEQMFVFSIPVKGSETKPYLGERILKGAYFNEGVCDVNHNSLQFSTRILVCTIMRPAVTVPHIDWF